MIFDACNTLLIVNKNHITYSLEKIYTYQCILYQFAYDFDQTDKLI